MYEELYVIKDGERFQLDLNTPSGITLNFKSNLFGDLSKITCSYTYTFKLPMTSNNRQILGLPEEIRTTTPFIRSRMEAEFIQNGVDILGKANLYLGNVTSKNYEAVLTWGVIDGFQDLKDNDISLRSLRKDSPVIDRYDNHNNEWVQEAKDWRNDVLVVHPYRAATPLEEDFLCTAQRDGNPLSLATIPAVPIREIVRLINEHYGLSFNLGAVYGGDNIWTGNGFASTDDSDIINRGVVPLVKVGLTNSQLAMRSAEIYNLSLVRYSLVLKNGQTIPLLGWNEGDFKMEQIIRFNIRQQPSYAYFDIGSGGNLKEDVNWVFYKKAMSGMKFTSIEKFVIDGCVTATCTAGGWSVKKNGYLNEDYSDVVPKFCIYRRLYEIDKEKSDGVRVVLKTKFEAVGSVSGRRTNGAMGTLKLGEITYYTCQWKFDFRKAEGFSPIEITEAYDEQNGSSSAENPYFFGFDCLVTSIDAQEPITITPKGRLSSDTIAGFETDIFSNLPDVTCQTFMKALFYIIGAFPVVKSNGQIVPVYYTALENNIRTGNVLDWSQKLATADTETAEKINFAISSVSQKNYYLLKNDELDKSSSDEENDDDVYESGMMHIDCPDRTLDKEKTIIQIPWYGPWLKSGKAPRYDTKNDMKYSEYDVEKDETKEVEAKPALGIIVAAKEGEYQQTGTNPDGSYIYHLQPTGKYRSLMKVLNPFKDVESNPNYAYLQKIFSAPCVVTEVIRLDEFDLRDLDYSVPIYLNKYNSYFAIVSIQRDSKGKCKCELIKLP